jgi:putative glutamine amidotransferase
MPERHPPIIGITTGIEQATWGDLWEGDAVLLPADYARGVARAGGIGVVLAPSAPGTAHPETILDAVDGLLISGGHDVDPASYGAEPQPRLEDTEPERDRFEIALIRAAIERDVPMLGICRGLQLLNVATGGSLHQHLPEVLGHDDHRRRVGTFHGNRHRVRIRSGSVLAGLHGPDPTDTASHHHQGIDRVGDHLAVSAVAEDGLPEAVEIPGAQFVLAVQWHPEIDDDLILIQALVDAARSRQLASTYLDTTPTGGTWR